MEPWRMSQATELTIEFIFSACGAMPDDAAKSVVTHSMRLQLSIIRQLLRMAE